MSMTFDELKGKILQRGTELIAQGVSTEQLAYLMKGLEVLESIREKDAVADAIAQIGDIQAKYVEAKNFLSQVLQAKAITQLKKPAIRLASRDMDWSYRETPYLPPTGNNTQKFTYQNLEWLKNNFILKTMIFLEFAPRNRFHTANHKVAWGNNYPIYWSMYLLKNNTDSDKTVSLGFQLSAYGNGVSGAYIVANGNVVYSYTNNGVPSSNVNLTVPANDGLLVLVQNCGYFINNNNNTYHYYLVHKVNFNLPEGVDWDYEAYAQLLN